MQETELLGESLGQQTDDSLLFGSSFCGASGGVQGCCGALQLQLQEQIHREQHRKRRANMPTGVW